MIPISKTAGAEEGSGMRWRRLSRPVMMSSAMATARSSATPSPPKKLCKGERTSGVPSLGHPPASHRGPTKVNNGKVSKSKSGKLRRPSCRKRRPDDDYPQHNMLLHRLSLPSSPSGTLLERIGAQVVETASALTDSGRSEGDSESDGAIDPPLSAVPHCYTPEPGEVERFLESVIGAPPPPPAGPVHACLGDKPTLALETHNLPVDHLVEVCDPSSSVLYSPTQTAVNSLSPTVLTLDQQSPLPGDTMPPSSLTPTALEECRKHLTPVLLAAAQARDPAKRLDSEQCARLLSDDHCRSFFRQATQMRLQLSSLVSQKTPTRQSLNGSPPILKRDRANDVDVCARRTRTRFSSTNTAVSNVSRRDSDITLVDFPGGRLPPKAPRAMLLASQAKLLNDAHNGAPDEPILASPIPQDRSASAASLLDLVHQAIKIFPALMPASQAEPTEIDMSHVPVGTATGDPTGRLVQVPASPTHSSSTDFVSQLPSQPGIWFRKQGRQHAQIVDVDIDLSDEMFYVSKERLRVHLRLCSVRVNAVTESDAPASLQDIDDVIERHALNWPKKGKLVVQVNPESERSKTWLPYLLESSPLDVTSCVQPGKNTFRFIQLSDLSEFTFVLAASPPPPEEEWRGWDWPSLVERAGSQSSSMADDDPMNSLSKFARIPVTLRS